MMRRKMTSRSVQLLFGRRSSSARTGSSSSDAPWRMGSVMLRSRQDELALERGEMTLHLGLADLRELIGPPARRIILVDDHGPYALVKILAPHDPRHDAELGPHAVIERPGASAPHLGERNLETPGRLSPHRLGHRLGWRDAIRFETGHDILDRIGSKMAIDRVPHRHDRPGCC